MTTKYLHRYTTLPSLVHLLKSKSLTLLSPETWDDANDSYGMARYKKARELETLLALCFTEASQTYHHWHVFAGDSAGVRITFNREKLLACLGEISGVRHGKVTYSTLKAMETKLPAVDDLPFIKRRGYQHEKEFRVIFEQATESEKVKQIFIPMDCIERITLSPWLAPALLETTREIIVNIGDCAHLRPSIFRSTLTGNNKWKRLIRDSITAPI